MLTNSAAETLVAAVKMQQTLRVELMASAVAAIQALEEASQSKSGFAEEGLRCLWYTHEGHTVGTVREQRVARLVLHQYFQRAGDWSAMRRDLIEAARSIGAEPDELERLIREKTAQARADLKEAQQ